MVGDTQGTTSTEVDAEEEDARTAATTTAATTITATCPFPLLQIQKLSSYTFSVT